MTRQVIAVAAALTAFAAGGALGQVNDYHDIKTPPLRSFTMPQPKRIQLNNGMVIFLQEDHELPLVRGSAVIRGGGRDVPADKAGLMGVYGQSWRTGGTTSKTGEQLDEFLETRAAHVEASGDEDSATVSFDVLKGDVDTVFPIFVDLLRNPAFRQEKIDLAKTQLNTGISRRNDDPGNLLRREATKLGYGADSPYARQPEYATVASITRDDLVALHRRFVHPNNIIIGVSGDFDSAKMEARLRETFGSWARGPQAVKPADAGHPAKPGVYFVGKDDVTQGSIAAVHSSPLLRGDPDYYAAVVLNEIFSGGFSGRLMNRLRSAMGLTYGVGGGFRAEWDHPGLFAVSMSTKSSTTMQSVDALRSELSNLLTQPFTNDEMQHAKDSLLNAFVFTTDSREKVLRQRMMVEFYGYPADFYQRYPASIQKVTADDVARVAKKYIHPDQLALLVLGKEKDFDKPMSSLGQYTTIDVTIPEPGAKASAPGASAQPAGPATSNAEGTALIGKLLAFVGGKAKIDAVQATHMVGSMTVKTPQGMMDIDVDLTARYPDSLRRVMKTPMGEMTMVMTPDAAFMIAPMGVQDIPGSQRDGMAKEARQDLLNVLKNVGKPGYTFTATRTEKIGNVDARAVEVGVEGTTMTWFIDPANGKLLRKFASGRMGETTTDFTEWKTVDGVTLPSAFTLTSKGENAGGGQLKSIEINPTVDPKLFQKP
jgi:zinc protease